MRRTEQQMAFVEAYVENGGNATKAAKAAGFSGDASNASKLVRRLSNDIAAAFQQTLASKAGQALQVLEAVMLNDAAAPRDRLRAASEILDRAGNISRITQNNVAVADRGYSFTDHTGHLHMGIEGKTEFVLPPKQPAEDDD